MSTVEDDRTYILTAEDDPIVDLIDEVISDLENEHVIESVRNRVHQMMEDRPLFVG